MIDHATIGDRVSLHDWHGSIIDKTYTKVLVRFDDGKERWFTRRIRGDQVFWCEKGRSIAVYDSLKAGD